MDIVLEIRTQAELYTHIKNIMRDTANNRWTAPEVYLAINQSLDSWSRRVKVPFVYDIPGGWISNQYAYDLPSWMRGTMDVQQKRYTGISVGGINVDLSSGATTWIDVPAWKTEPTTNGGQVLRIGVLPYNVEGRILWWAPNGHVPLSVPNLNAAIVDAAATTLTITGVPYIGKAGYVYIDQEWIAYNGFTRTASTTTLLNLRRGQNGTEAATHLINAPTYWGVAVHREDLFNQLAYQARALLYSLFLTDAAPREIDHHTFQMRYWQQMADEFWKHYAPARSPKFRLSREGIASPR